MPAPRNGRAAEERMFSAIVDAILDQRLAPGTKLKERELAGIFGASRAAVRSVLNRLGHSLLVELRPNRGAIIANPSAEETRDLLDARRLLEAALVQRLAQPRKDRCRGIDIGEGEALAVEDEVEGRSHRKTSLGASPADCQPDRGILVDNIGPGA